MFFKGYQNTKMMDSTHISIAEKPLSNPSVKDIEEVYKRPFMCAGFARRYSEILLIGDVKDKRDELYVRSPAWNFQYHNRKIWSLEEGLFNPEILKRGMLLGIRLPHSIFNGRRDERGNPVRNTHMAVFKETRPAAYGVEYVIAHNVGGDLLQENLFDFLQRNEGSYVIDVFAPKEEKLLAKS